MSILAISSFYIQILSSAVTFQVALRLNCAFKKTYRKLNSVFEQILCNTYIIATVIV